MRAFQDEGHTGVLIVGDYTTRIGDPSGRSAERPVLSDEEIDRNAKTLPRAGDDHPRPRAHRGALQRRVALEALTYAEVVRLARTITVARILERDDFAKRYAANEPISVSELLYPLMQAYDSVAIEADVELGGTDQLYNLLAGRDVMEAYGLEPQVVLTTPLLLSWDGEKMSSSVGNNIPLTAAPEEQFGRTMRIPDDLLARVVPARLRAARRRRATRSRRSSRWRGSSSRGRTGRRRRGRRRSTSRASSARARRRRRCPRRRCRRAIPSTCRRSSPLRSASVDERGSAADRAGRRQGRRRGRHVELRPAAGTARRSACSGRKAPVRPLRLLDTRLTLAIIPRLPERAAWKSP